VFDKAMSAINADILASFFALALGWVCLRYAFYWHGRGFPKASVKGQSYNEHEDRPLMIIPLALGILFMLVGGGLLVMAIIELNK
jgi:hypothetical protein